MARLWLVWLGVWVIGCDSGDGGSGGAGGGAADGTAAGGAGGAGGDVADAAPDAEPPASCVDDPECPADQYCAPINDFEGVCRAGCRRAAEGEGPGNCEGRTICSAEHACIPDPHCIEDGECVDQTTWCSNGDCVPGCRPDPDTCLPDAEGRSQLCNPTSRVCEPIVACCDGGTCATTRSGACSAVVDGVFSCFVEDLCDRVCMRDVTCPEDQYCDAGICRPGCRLDDPTSCVGDLCDEASRACVPVACGVDRDCARTQFCAPQGCLEGCRVDPDNCEAGQECGPNRQCRAVGGCVDDAQCVRDNGAGFRCIEGGCELFCAADVDCGAGAFCEVDTGRCVEGCRDDGLEPNNDRATAQPLAVVDGMRFRQDALIACPVNRDWYSFTTARGEGAEVAIRFRHARGDLDLRVHPPEGNPVVSATQTDDETVTLRDVAAGGTWYIEVYSRGLDTNTYAVEVNRLPPGGCVPDAAEGAGDDAPQTATAVQVPDLRDVQVFDSRTACGDDADWYRLPMGNGDGVVVELTVQDPLAPALDFALFGPGLPPLGVDPVFGPNGGDATTLRFSAPAGNPQIAAGDWYLRVWNPSAMGGTAYRLRIAVDRVRALCLVDVAEPNIDAQNAYDLMQVRGFTRPGLDGVRELVPDVDLDVADLWLCGGDEDWYAFEARAGDDLAVSVVRPAAMLQGDVLVEIRNAAGQVVGDPGRNAQALNVARAADLLRGRYFVRVVAPAPGTQTRYTLRLNRVAGPIQCNADRFEAAGGNGDRGRASPLRAGVIDGLTLCGGNNDEDWYVVTLDSVSDLTVRALFSHLQADLDVDIFRGDAPVAENADSLAGHSLDDNEEVALPDRLPGLWYIRVQAANGGDARYTLEVEVTPRAFICLDDPDEPNDSVMLATDLGAGVVDRNTQWLCDRVPAEADAFRFRVPGGQARTVAASFVYGDDGDLVLEVYNAAGALLATTVGIARELSKQCITLPPFAADRNLVLRVVPLSINRVLDNDERLDYRLRILQGENCEAVAPPTPGTRWPVVPLPN